MQVVNVKAISRIVVALGVAVPAPVLGQALQSVKSADLVGAWVTNVWVWDKGQADSLRGKTAASVVTYNADSTFTSEIKWLDGHTWRLWENNDHGSWKLAGNTIQMINKDQRSYVPQYVMRKGQQLLRWSQWDRTEEESCADISERFDPTKPLTPPPASTLKPTDVVGTWVSTADGGQDSLVFEADSTATITLDGERIAAYGSSARWYLSPRENFIFVGELQLKGPTTKTLTLKDGKLTSCDQSLPPVLTRAAP